MKHDHQELKKEIFIIISRASRVWHEKGRQEEALLHSHQNAVTGEIMQLLVKHEGEILEDVKKWIICKECRSEFQDFVAKKYTSQGEEAE